MTESLVLSTIGAVLGLVFAWFGREALLRLVSEDGSRAPVAVETDVRLMAFVALVSVATAILFDPQTAGYRGEQASAITERLLERLKTVPGVGAISFSDNGVMFGRDSHTNLIRPEGFVAGKEGYPRVAFDVVGPNYFSTMGIPLAAGRDFTERDDLLAPRAIAINEEMATRFFPGANPVGRRLIWGPQEHLSVLEVIAVARDVKQRSPRDEKQLRFYLPYAQRPTYEFASVQFLVRTAGDSAAMLPMLQRAISTEGPRLSPDGVYFANELIDRSLVQERMITKLSFAFGALAVCLACIGLYGLIGYQVVQRTNEIGIRMALGARRTQVLWTTLRRALVWTMAGVALGIPLALTASRAAESLLFGLSPMDVVTLSAAAVIMLMLGALAAYIPAHRASRVDPLVALRYE